MNICRHPSSRKSGQFTDWVAAAQFNSTPLAELPGTYLFYRVELAHESLDVRIYKVILIRSFLVKPFYCSLTLSKVRIDTLFLLHFINYRCWRKY